MTPPPLARKWGTACWMQSSMPMTLTSNTRRQSAAVWSRKLDRGAPIPALQKRMSSLAYSAMVRSVMALTWASSATSTSSPRATPPRSVISCSTELALAGSRSAMTTLAPSSAKSSADARPSPAPAPVMMATLSFRRTAAPCLVGSGLVRLVEVKGQVVQPTDERSIERDLLGANRQTDVGHPREQPLEGDAGFRPGQGGAKTEVRTMTEGQVVAGAAPDVEPVGGRTVLLRVAIPRSPPEEDPRPGRKGYASELGVVLDDPRVPLDRWFEAQRLFEHGRDHPVVVGHDLELVAMREEQEHGRRQQAGRGLVAAGEEDADEIEHLGQVQR